ncbi:ATP-binding protein [Candidatus Saganbacteria bacterium]|nr:ATP-binding protein [Candidatus Saganbacteria bacterium]
MNIPRYYDNLETLLFPNKVLVIFGSRQVGKTTLLNNYLAETKFKYKIDSGDNITVSQILGSQNFSTILDYVEGYELIIIDEAQRIPGIGLGLKIIVDQVPGIRVIATGSSSFELSGQIGEPLTGRKNTLTLYPLAQLEFAKLYNKQEMKDKLAEWLVFGGYPAVANTKGKKKKITVLEEIVNSYLLKDILELERIKAPKTLLDLLRLIAFQVGAEVSLSELGSQLGIDTKTVARYLDLLEKAFVVFNLRGYSRNLRQEITRKSKYYFLDNGIRNAIISSFNGLDNRADIGQLWENFLVVERLKTQAYKNIHANNYFWRTWEQKELDWIEERDNKLFGYEFKYSEKKTKISKEFHLTYPEAKTAIINRENYLPFIGVAITYPKGTRTLSSGETSGVRREA